MALGTPGKQAIRNGVRDLTAFKHGSVKGMWYPSWADVPRGWLTVYVSNVTVPDDVPVYVIFSYHTPIAWAYRLDSSDRVPTWYVPEVKHSPTTTNHQANVRLAIAEAIG